MALIAKPLADLTDLEYDILASKHTSLKSIAVGVLGVYLSRQSYYLIHKAIFEDMLDIENDFFPVFFPNDSSIVSCIKAQKEDVFKLDSIEIEGELTNFCSKYCGRYKECQKKGNKYANLVCKHNSGGEIKVMCCSVVESYKADTKKVAKYPTFYFIIEGKKYKQWSRNLGKLLHKCGSNSTAAKKSIPWRRAYELNKTRTKCIICGRETKDQPIHFSIIKYCDCVNEYAKKNSNVMVSKSCDI